MVNRPRRLRELAPERRGDVGAKAASLGLIHRLGLRVPEGFVLDNSYFEAFVGALGLTGKIALLESIVWTIKREHSEKISAEIEAALRAAPFPAAAGEVLAEALAEARLGSRRLVCRSSSGAEDSEDLAFPGVFRTVLDIEGVDDLKRAIVACYASLFERRAISYLLHGKPRRAPFTMALVVQEQVESELAGVLFTRDPGAPARHATVVEVVPGAGEGLASGGVTPHRYEREAPAGAWELASAPDPRDRGRDEGGPLTRERLDRLAEIGATLKQATGSDVDVEFAFVAGEGEPHVLQSRPITTAAARALGPDPFEAEALAVRPGVGCAGGFGAGVGVVYAAWRGGLDGLKDRVVLLRSLTLADYDLLYVCSAIVTEKPDSKLNHISIACREIGLPYVAGVEGACAELDGALLGVNGDAGKVYVLPASHAGAGSAALPQAPRAVDVEQGVAYLPLLGVLPRAGAGPARFVGMAALLIEAAYHGRSRAELARFLEQEIASLAGAGGSRATVRMPELKPAEIAALRRAVPDFPDTPEAVIAWLEEIFAGLDGERAIAPWRA